jgi:UDP:flavonoid glycosyltransferase YjiC (YdhE family)
LPVNFNIQKVLVAPLDWGLGHATRCIPLIRGLLDAGMEVVLAAEGVQAALLSREFPALECLPLFGYRARYSKRSWALPFTMMMQSPKLFKMITKEREWLADVIETHGIDLVISDNRYGLSSKKIPCIFITHQLTIKAPFGWLENILQKINYRFINRFTCCWVPDAAGDENLAGVLSHPKKMPAVPVHYIGMLARFAPQQLAQKFDVCIVLSGPEPQRTLLEKKIVRELFSVEGKVVLVRGKPSAADIFALPPHVTVYNHLPTEDLQQLVLQSQLIISRSGYTTVMEMAALGKNMLLIPTPGQTEQEYLAERLQQTGICRAAKQQGLDLAKELMDARPQEWRTISISVFKPADMPALLRNSLRAG